MTTSARVFEVQRGSGVKRALISDIHANLEALRVVMDDIRAAGIREIYCLGDIVGYGPIRASAWMR